MEYLINAKLFAKCDERRFEIRLANVNENEYDGKEVKNLCSHGDPFFFLSIITC